MEIDFLGLGVDPGAKDETGSKDSAPESASALEMRRIFWDKVSQSSRMFSFQTTLEEKPQKTMGEFGPKPLANSFQKNVLDVPAQRYYTATSFPLQQFQARPVGSNPEMKKLAVWAHPGQILASATIIQSQPPVLNFPVGHTTMLPVSSPQIGSPVSRDARAPKSLGSLAQLTIFFAGSVCVYDDVSPEKAQAIMSLAANSSPVSVSPSKPVTTTQVQSQPIRPSLDEACSGKNSLMLSFSSSLFDTQQVNNSKQAITTAPTLVQADHHGAAVAIPQARKVSLARFLERRKERMIKASPYGLNKRSPEHGGVPSDNLSCSATNSTGSVFNPEVSHK